MWKKTQSRGDNDTRGQAPVEQARLDAVKGGAKIWKKSSSKGTTIQGESPCGKSEVFLKNNAE